jgi:lysozyme family protein
MGYIRAKLFTGREEGGYVHHPTDPGGATNKGITQAVYDSFRRAAGMPVQSVRVIADHEVDAIYSRQYWVGQGKYAPRCDLLSEFDDDLAIAHYDFAVNSGGLRANQTLQRIAEVPTNAQDGILGPQSIHYIKKADRRRLLEHYIERTLCSISSPTSPACTCHSCVDGCFASAGCVQKSA